MTHQVLQSGGSNMSVYENNVPSPQLAPSWMALYVENRISFVCVLAKVTISPSQNVTTIYTREL